MSEVTELKAQIERLKAERQGLVNDNQWFKGEFIELLGAARQALDELASGDQIELKATLEHIYHIAVRNEDGTPTIEQLREFRSRETTATAPASERGRGRGMDWDNPRNAEGYCKKCGQPLGISGQCTVCAINNDDFKALWEKVFTCPICRQPKHHTRLYGYRCHNPEHAALEAEQERAELDRKLKGKR